MATTTADARAIPAATERGSDRLTHVWPIRIVSIIIGIMWFEQILWKLPWNNFVSPGEPPNGVEPNPNPTAEQPGPYIDNGRGAYHWMVQGARFGILGYNELIRNVALPNWQLFGWLTFLAETTIAVLLILGLLSRLGGLIALFQSANLYLAISRHPQEWHWTYLFLIALSFIFLFTGPGRWFGIDQWLRPRLRAAYERSDGSGNGLARLLYRLT
ncbi:MAG TPA: TQO small subunit DoxD [Chloroflexia bacterium]|nr:TQO small subunit DoxD [Chloroflexia bacterium]